MTEPHAAVLVDEAYSAIPPPRVPRTTWSPMDLAPILARGALEDPPAMLVRSDGNALLYRGRVHAFNGEPESGKTFLALAACVERIQAGDHVAYIDFEDHPEPTVGRLLALGANAGSLEEFFHYIRPDEPLAGEARADLEAFVAATVPTLVVVDGVTEAMTVHGWDLSDNAHVARFMDAIPRRIARSGATVVQVDHVAKDRVGRGRYALGGQHKLAGIDGAAYSFEVVRPLGRGLDGLVRVTVAKDRPGYVRQISAGGRYVGELRLHGAEDGSLRLELRPVEGGVFRPTVLMERVSCYLERAGEVSLRRVLDEVPGNRDAKALAARLLVEEGYAAVREAGQARLHRILRPFRSEGEEGKQ